jgi:hypothetical protein
MIEYAIALLVGLIIGALVGLAFRTCRESDMHREVVRQDQIIESLLNEISRLARRPINLGGVPAKQGPERPGGLND